MKMIDYTLDEAYKDQIWVILIIFVSYFDKVFIVGKSLGYD